MTSTLTVDTIQGSTTAANVKLRAGGIVNYGYAEYSILANTGTQSYTSTNYTDITGVTISYTPKYSGSKCLINFNLYGRFFVQLNNDMDGYFRTHLAGSASKEYRVLGDNLGKLGDAIYFPMFINIADEYTTTGTSPVTFKLQTKAGTSNLYFQVPHHSDNQAHHTVTVLEIAQ